MLPRWARGIENRESPFVTPPDDGDHDEHDNADDYDDNHDDDNDEGVIMVRRISIFRSPFVTPPGYHHHCD